KSALPAPRSQDSTEVRRPKRPLTTPKIGRGGPKWPLLHFSPEEARVNDKLFQTRVTASEAAEFDVIAGACNASRFELLRRVVRATIEEWRAQGRPAPQESEGANAGVPAAALDRDTLIMACHELAMRR